MIQTYRFRLYSASKLESLMAETIETWRCLCNDLLDDRIENRIGAFEQKRLLTTRRGGNKYLGQVHSQVLQDVVFRLDKAFGSFFGGLSKYLRFRKRGRYNTFTYPVIRIGKFGRESKKPTAFRRW